MHDCLGMCESSAVQGIEIEDHQTPFPVRLSMVWLGMEQPYRWVTLHVWRDEYTAFAGMVGGYGVCPRQRPLV